MLNHQFMYINTLKRQLGIRIFVIKVIFSKKKHMWQVTTRGGFFWFFGGEGLSNDVFIIVKFFFHYNNFALYVNRNIMFNSIIFRFFLQFFTDAKKFFLISSLMHCFSFRFSVNQPHLSSIMPRHNVNKGILTTDRTSQEGHCDEANEGCLPAWSSCCPSSSLSGCLHPDQEGHCPFYRLHVSVLGLHRPKPVLTPSLLAYNFITTLRADHFKLI